MSEEIERTMDIRRELQVGSERPRRASPVVVTEPGAVPGTASTSSETKTGSSTIRVLVADDHAVVRNGIISMLSAQPDIEVVGEASSGEEAVCLFRLLLPSVLLLDLSMPGMGGQRALETIRREFPKAKVIVLTVREGDEDVRRALDAGAAGYFLKDVSATRIVAAIRAVDGGMRDVPEDLLRRVECARADLTERELEVLQLVAKGFSNREIGELLAITEGTVKTHVVNILAKLSARDRTEAVTTALGRGVLHLS